MRKVLSKTNIFNLLICRSILKFLCNKLISWFSYKKININKENS